MERAVEKNEKLESFQLESLKLERGKRNWKELIEVGKNRAKFERTSRNWKVLAEVGKFIISSKLGLGKLTNLA